ncbi:hypothetical protein HKD37_02G004674 [Glycine soja]
MICTNSRAHHSAYFGNIALEAARRAAFAEIPRFCSGRFDAAHYVTERQWARASDETFIPLSIGYRKYLVNLMDQIHYYFMDMDRIR